MAGVDSTQITNMDTNPPTRATAREFDARVKTSVEVVEKTASNDTGEDFRFFRVHSSWVPVSIQIYNDALTGITDVDVGLYTIRQGSVVDADILADGVTLATANLGEVLYSSAALRAAAGQALWERLSLTSDPSLWYDLALTVNTTTATAGTIPVVVSFLVGS